MSIAAIAAMVATTSCTSTGDASPPGLDQDAVGGVPVFQPMLVVPMPSLQREVAPGRRMEALQARRTPLGDVLLALFKDSDINLLVDAAVQATECTFDIKRSTVEETFEALLRSLDLAYEWDGGYLRVRETVRETLHVDLMEASGQSGGGSGNSGSSGSNSSSSGSSSGSSSSSDSGDFWETIEANLPTLLGEGATFVINRPAATIHVQARPSGIERLRELVDTTVRRANKQVSLEARILEVRLNNEHSLGINWSMLPGLFNSNKTGLAGGGAVVAQTAASGGTALNFGVLDTGDFSVFVDALELQGQVRVLSSPRVSTMNNQPASIGVTDQLPYITREIIDSEGVARTQYGVEFVESGVSLQVRPMIGEDGILSVAVTPTVREQTGTVVTPDGLVEVPVVSQREATTLVRVSNGQAIALGGLRSTRKDETRQGVPFVMDLPVIGQFFSSTVQSRTEVELMIVLVPRVLDDTWIEEEVRRGADRLVQLRRGFQWNSIQLDGYRTEDWSGGSLQGLAEAASAPEARVAAAAPAPVAADGGLTVTRAGLAGHLLARAQAEIDGGRIAAALDTIEKALVLQPTQVGALVAGGVLYERQGNRARARTLLDRALELAPADVVALSARGALELVEGSPHSARRYLQRAHELGNTALTAANLGAALLVLGESQAARALLLPLAEPSAPPEVHANLAFASVSVGELVQARQHLRLALVAGADARNPRLVALERLVGEAEAAAAAAK